MNPVRTIVTGVVASALTASTLLVSPALATPGSGVAVVPVVNGQFGTIQQNTASEKTGKWGMFLKTLDDTDVGADKLVVQPQGTTGWHSHQAPVFVTVTQGTIQWIDSLLCTPRTLTVGQSVVEPAGRAHNVRNPAAAGGQVAEFVAGRIKPTSVVGLAFRVDEPVPHNCSG